MDMYGYWYDDGGNYYSDDDYIPKNTCRHSWKPILLLTTTVYNCQHCDAKKEEVENEQRKTKK